MATDKVEELLAAAKALTPADRRRLLEKLRAADAESAGASGSEANAVEALLALSGTATSAHSDLSTNKYEHVAAASDDR